MDYNQRGLYMGIGSSALGSGYDQQQQESDYYYNVPSRQDDYPSNNASYNSYQPQYISESYAYENDPGEQWDQHQSSEFLPTVATESGSYYAIGDIQVETSTAPVTAIAYDSAYTGVYIATATDRVATTEGSRLPSTPLNRASMVVTYNTTDGALYSSVAAHPEAPAKVLSYIYESIYGGPVVGSTAATSGNDHLSVPTIASSRPTGRQRVPAHAYQPPYGASTAIPEIGVNSSAQMGINTILPLSSGCYASVSPAAIRVHSQGGLQIADLHLEGLICGTAHPSSARRPLNSFSSSPMHMALGGVNLRAALATVSSTNSTISKSWSNQHLYCVDLSQGLKTVSSSVLDRNKLSSESNPASTVAVTTLATNSTKGTIVAGCSDGQVRLFDGSLRQLANIKCHTSGVTDVAVSPDGSLIATTGFGIRSTNGIYAFPDPVVQIFDVRFLGRGGFAHPFAGARSGPRHVAFVPNMDGYPSNRFLVASGLSGGGMQVIVPFEEQTGRSADFLVPALQHGECITCLAVSEENLAVGTTQGRALQYALAGYDKQLSPLRTFETGSHVKLAYNRATGGNTRPMHVESSPHSVSKLPLESVSFQPAPPLLPIDPTVLLNDSTTKDRRGGLSELSRSIFSSYILCAQPSVSSIGDPRASKSTSFGPLATDPIIPGSRFTVSPELMKNVSRTVDFLQTVPVNSLDIDVFADHRLTMNKDGRKPSTKPLQNPNKFIYCDRLYAKVYEKCLNRKTVKTGSKVRREDEFGGEHDDYLFPPRYRLTLRPSHKSVAMFNHATFNQTDYLPGFDYPPTMNNAFVPPVVLMLYFIPEVRSMALKAQVLDKPSPRDKSLVPELGFLFHRIETIARQACFFPPDYDGTNRTVSMDVWSPSDFVSCLSTMPEADQLQILDGSPEAIDKARRPEAFYRFLLYQLDKENGKVSSRKVMESLSGMTFISINGFVSDTGPPSTTKTTVLSVDLSYEPFLTAAALQSKASFGEVLQYNLCRETRLRAWNHQSNSYETIVQRKICTSLPPLLSLSASCAGRAESEGLVIWRGSEGCWLPEFVEVELESNGNVIVRELIQDQSDGTEAWKECRGGGPLPDAVSEAVLSGRGNTGSRKQRYRLDAVVTYVRDDYDFQCPEDVRSVVEAGIVGHHVLHVRVPKELQKSVLEQQRDEILKYILTEDTVGNMAFVHKELPRETLQTQLSRLERRLSAITKSSSGNEWVLINGFVALETSADDARSFHPKLKEPSVIVYRAVDSNEIANESIWLEPSEKPMVSPTVIRSTSLTNGVLSNFVQNQTPETLPGKGDLVAFDAEFVSVQEEESLLSDSGSKITLRETRHAVARISVLDCKILEVLFDDYVVPREPVVDYLTRFSGIVAQDLNLNQSQRHLISTRLAYLKLRCLIERGCIFVGHGLRQDFWTINLTCPKNQIIDTVELFHKPGHRYISLRFLTNFVLKRDMQQDVHDSVEDALAAYQLYQKAIELKALGRFDSLMNELYSYGNRTDWKLGVGTDESEVL